MSLSCYCDFDTEPGLVYWYPPGDYFAYSKPRATACKCCGKRIESGDLVVSVSRYKVPEYEVELSIYGDDGEIPRAPHYFCKTCADLYFSLYDIGFECVDIYNIRDEVRDYAGTYGPAPQAREVPDDQA